jgi:hypothetical protein
MQTLSEISNGADHEEEEQGEAAHMQGKTAQDAKEAARHEHGGEADHHRKDTGTSLCNPGSKSGRNPDATFVALGDS